MTFQFVDALLAYDWPFNVRELEAAIRHAIAMSGGATLDVSHLPEAVMAGPRDRTESKRRPPKSEPPGDRAAPPDGTPRDASPSVERLRSLLTKHRGNVAAVARELGKDRAQIHRWLRYAQIDPAQYR
jgi:transcriptional regulator of acetoin/glycerol metabolism